MSSDPDTFKAILSFIRIRIESELNGRVVVAPGYLDDAVHRFGAFFQLNDSAHERVVRHLETVFGTQQEDGHLLKSELKEWFPAEKPSIDFYYWRRLEKYWRDHSILPIDVIRSVDGVTDEILGFLGNPRDKTGWNRRRGLVMGHVQMGKTTNYSALISKAADAGYRIIIVLAGITNSLRYQTQVRLDKTFVGKSSVSDSTHTKVYDVARVFVGEREDYLIRHPYCGTSQLSDFNMAAANTTGAHEGNFADPILFVTKKNPKVLERLADWLKGLRHGEKLDGPMLLIDDEADNASVNTNADPRIATAINHRIRVLLHTSKQSTYIGYTATPFANIFIDPDTTDNWAREDLFPADFIKSLDPPTNYVGARRLFAEDGDLRNPCVRIIPNDHADLLPVKHQASHRLAALPPSLVDAVREYVLARAVRIARGDGSNHSAMLLNVSRFNAVQEQVRNLVDDQLAELQAGIEAWAMANWESSIALQELKRVWDLEYDGTVEYDWNGIRCHLNPSISSIRTLLVNMRGGGINYETAPSTGLHVIGVGGLALARGLTLEGLLVSYVLRNVGASDTLLQMGRWFGYRPGFEQMCRIHVTSSVAANYEEVSNSVEELRADFERMALLGKTPFEFGLKVRQSSTGIAITAANKMRSATEISLAQDFSAKHVQAYAIHESNEANRRNRSAVEALLGSMDGGAGTSFLQPAVNARVWKGVPVAEVLRFIGDLDLPQTEFSALAANGSSLLSAYIEDRRHTELKSWDVAMPFVVQSKFEKSIEYPFGFDSGLALYCRSRHNGVRQEKLLKITEKNAVAFGEDDLAYGEDKDALSIKAHSMEADAVAKKIKPPSKAVRFASSRSTPLLVIHLLDFELKKEEEKKEPLRLEKRNPVVTISMVFPGTAVPCKERRYQASPRLMQLLADLREEAKSDEDLEDE